MSSLNKMLSGVLGSLIVGLMIGIVYFNVFAPAGEGFTEFFILGPEGRAADYPDQIGVHEVSSIIVGINNREHEAVSYWVEVLAADMPGDRIGPILLEHNQSWQEETTFSFDKVGENQKIEFLLFKEEDSQPHDILYLTLDVR